MLSTWHRFCVLRPSVPKCPPAQSKLSPLTGRLQFFRIFRILGFFELEKFKNSPARLISSELRAHQMSPSGVPPHWRSRRALQLIRAECSSNGSCWSHPALAESSRTPTSVACPRLLQCGASAGHVVEYNVMDMMVGNRRAPGATILGGVLEYDICQPSLLCPADGSCTS